MWVHASIEVNYIKLNVIVVQIITDIFYIVKMMKIHSRLRNNGRLPLILTLGGESSAKSFTVSCFSHS